jgi:PAS domain S-box-containing protein
MYWRLGKGDPVSHRYVLCLLIFMVLIGLCIGGTIVSHSLIGPRDIPFLDRARTFAAEAGVRPTSEAYWSPAATKILPLMFTVAALSNVLVFVVAFGALLVSAKRNRSPSITPILIWLSLLSIASGCTSIIDALKFWWPALHFEVIVKTMTAIASAVAFAGLIGAVPRAMSFREREKLREAENELRQSKQRFERALQGSYAGLWEWNIDADEVWYAPRFKELLGYGDKEFPNAFDTWLKAIHADDAQAMLAALRRHLDKDEPFDVEHRLQTKSGEYRWFQSRGVAIRCPNGKPYLMAGSLQDIHLRKQAQEHLRERDEQLRQAQKMEAVGTLAGGIAHEFNNLVQAILGYTQYAMEDLPESDERYSDLQQVLKASRRAASLTKQLLGFSRRQVLEFACANLNGLVRDHLKLIRPLIGENISIDLELDEDIEMVEVDAGQFQQLLMNLCINARDAMPSGGQLFIKTSRVNANGGGDLPTELSPGRYVLITVRDTGSGIPDDVLAHVFEPFFTTKDVGKGTGLGLAMAYGIVQQHRGAIHFDSAVGVGTSVKIYLPATDVLGPCADELDAYEILRGSETILIAEDEPLVRDLAVRVLEGAGYKILTASDGEEAVRVFQQNIDSISLVLLDVVMPLLSGHDVLKRIRMFRPDIQVVFCSGYDPDIPVNRLLSDESLPYLEKPFEPNTLLQTIRHALDDVLCQLI